MLAAALLALAPPPAAPAPPPDCVVFEGGPAQGLCQGETLGRDGNVDIVSLRPGRDAGPAIPAEGKATLDRALAAQPAGGPIAPTLLAPGATGEFCLRFGPECNAPAPLTAWRVPGDYHPAAPYLLADGRVRIGWTKGGKLVLLSFVTLEGGRIKDIATAPAIIPIFKLR